MNLSNEPERGTFQDVAVGERVYREPYLTGWYEKIPAKAGGLIQINAKRYDGKQVYIYPLEVVWRPNA